MSQLRVIAGKAKGLRIDTVPGETTRPITDQVKEALFNILGTDVIGSNWLDCFGGTGAVGIEALSRGANFVRFIDLNRLAVETIKRNLDTTHLRSQAEILQMDAFSVLRAKPDRTFEYIYIAPPQYKDMWLQALQVLDNNIGWASDDAWIIVQIHPIEYKQMEFTHFAEFEQRKYGSTILVFYEIKAA